MSALPCSRARSRRRSRPCDLPGALKTRTASGLKDFDLLLSQAAQRAPPGELVDILDIGFKCGFRPIPYVRRLSGETLYLGRRRTHHGVNMLNWFFKRNHRVEMASREDVQQAIDRIVGISPQVKLVNSYRSRLAPTIGKALGYVRQIVAALPPPRDLAPSAWANDPNLRAMFATRDDVAEVIGRSHELRAWFDDHLAEEHAHAVLSSTLVERWVLGTVLEGGVMRSDVARTAVGFEDKRIRFCNETEAALREEIVQRMVEQFALEAMLRVSAQEARRDALKEHRALLTARIHMLGRRGAGMSGLIAFADSDGDTARQQRDFEENEAALAALGSPADAIDMQLRTIVEVLQQPSALLDLTRRTLRFNQMNLVVEKDSDERCADVALDLARLPTQPPQTRVVGLVRVARRDMPPAGAAFNDVANIIL